MTFEEIQRAIEQMLTAQRELQESQFHQRGDIERMLAVQRELQESQLRQRDDIDRLIRLVDRLVGYSITNESEHLNLEERMNALERRMRRLEENEA